MSSFEKLEDLITAVRNGQFLDLDYYEGLETDDVLDARDQSGAFDDDWIEVYQMTEGRWEAEVAPLQQRIVDSLRESAFKMITEETEQNEIALYVSDDFDLIARCKLLKIDHALPRFLERSYLKQIFPMPGDGGVYPQ